MEGGYMDLESMIDERLVHFGLDVKNKDDAITKIAHMMLAAGKVADENAYLEGLYEREREFETGIGNGIAIPHCKNKCVKDAAFTLVRLNQAVEWGAMDNLPVKYVIMLAAPDSKDNAHLDMLAGLARKLMDTGFLNGLLEADTIDDIRKAFH